MNVIRVKINTTHAIRILVLHSFLIKTSIRQKYLPYCKWWTRLKYYGHRYLTSSDRLSGFLSDSPISKMDTSLPVDVLTFNQIWHKYIHFWYFTDVFRRSYRLTYLYEFYGNLIILKTYSSNWPPFLSHLITKYRIWNSQSNISDFFNKYVLIIHLPSILYGTCGNSGQNNKEVVRKRKTQFGPNFDNMVPRKIPDISARDTSAIIH